VTALCALNARSKNMIRTAFKLCFQFQLAPVHAGMKVNFQTHMAPVIATAVNAALGRAVQVDPIKPTMKAPEHERLKP